MKIHVKTNKFSRNSFSAFSVLDFFIKIPSIFCYLLSLMNGVLVQFVGIENSSKTFIGVVEM